jgi:hypothetical protein
LVRIGALMATAILPSSSTASADSLLGADDEHLDGWEGVERMLNTQAWLPASFR